MGVEASGFNVGIQGYGVDIRGDGCLGLDDVGLEDHLIISETGG